MKEQERKFKAENFDDAIRYIIELEKERDELKENTKHSIAQWIGGEMLINPKTKLEKEYNKGLQTAINIIQDSYKTSSFDWIRDNSKLAQELQTLKDAVKGCKIKHSNFCHAPIGKKCTCGHDKLKELII